MKTILGKQQQLTTMTLIQDPRGQFTTDDTPPYNQLPTTATQTRTNLPPAPLQILVSTPLNATHYASLFHSAEHALLAQDDSESPLSLAPATVGLRLGVNLSQVEGSSWQIWHRAGESDGLLHAHWLRYAPLPYGFHVCVGLIMVLTAVSSIVGNGLVLWSVIRFRSLRTSSNFFIISLAVADILMSSVDFPLFAAASFLGYWPFGYHVCQVYGATTGTAGLVTINTLTAISFDRYTVMVRRVGPINHISKHMTIMVIVVIWMSSVLWVTLPLAGWSYYTLEGIGTSCTFDYITRTAKNASFVVVLMVTNFVLPLILILYSYVRIFMSVSSVQKGLMDCSPQIAVGTQRLRFHRQTELKTASTMLMIVCFFCVAWTPYVIVALIGLFGDQTLVTPLVSAIPCIFAKIGTVSNPPLYSIGHPKFRKKIRYLVKSVFRWGSDGNNTSPHSTQDTRQGIYL